MKSKQLQIELLDQIETFEASVSGDTELTMDNFITFLNNRDIGNSLSSRNAGIIDSVGIHIAKDTSLLHRYSKFYIKKALKETSLQTVDEYTYLVSLLYVESLTKTELNNLNAMEKTSGSEIIKRLMKNGLI
ncbi:MAG: MarR family transcriptional regulator, partial [Bacteroidales bacterium]|nr:MarR family transcriptional regulator [Bacteroidales bacterium]